MFFDKVRSFISASYKQGLYFYDANKTYIRPTIFTVGPLPSKH
jgi:hypothetical protein